MGSIPVLNTLLIAFLIFIPAFFLWHKNKLALSRLDAMGLILGPLVLMGLSFFFFSTRVGGTVLYTAHGWPHTFALHQIEDVLDKTPIDAWHFVPGSLFSYVLADFIFYGVVLLLALVVIKKYGRCT